MGDEISLFNNNCLTLSTIEKAICIFEFKFYILCVYTLAIDVLLIKTHQLYFNTGFI